MSELLFNGPQSLANKRNIEQIIDSDPLFDRDDRHFQSREQAYERGCQQAVRLWELTRKYQWNKADGSYAYAYVDARLPYGLHYAMFVPAIEAQGTREQRRKWLPLCYDLKIIGTYAQTGKIE
jgi:acyl-CoA oxidase